jgi:hypothetical protein
MAAPQGGKRMFFFEKKNQKTFASLSLRCGYVRDSEKRGCAPP